MATTDGLEGRVAVVTGGARRVGAAIVRGLHAAGMNVLVHYRSSADEAAALAAELEARRPGSCHLHACDILDTGGLDGVVGAALERFGRLDLLVNNASSFYPTPLELLDEAAWDDLIGTNLKAPLFLARAAAPHLAERRGCIVNVADVYGRRVLAGHVVYCVAKAGLLMLTRCLARELAPAVRVNAVAPGVILWPEAEREPEAKRQLLAEVPLGRIGGTDPLVRAVLFLVRDATFTTGSVIDVDGGRFS